MIEDIKTYSKLMEKRDLKVPLQHVIYSLALKGMFENNINIRCTYDLPLCDSIQDVDQRYLQKGILELQDMFEEIKYSDFEKLLVVHTFAAPVILTAQGLNP